MRKIISAFLVCSMLILCLAGCSLFDRLKDDDTLIDSDSDLVKAIVSYMTEGDVERDLPSPSLTYRIDSIKEDGAELLEVTFNSFDHYFICGYSNDHDVGYDKGSECSWHVFSSADKIPEYRNGKKCVFAFQINVASSVKNLLTDETAPKIEHFTVYEPKFTDGYNVCSPGAFDQTILYLNGIFFDSAEKNTVYFTTDSCLNPWATIPYIEMDTEKCLLLRHEYESTDDIRPELVFGEYYDEFSSLGKLDTYEIYLSDGSTFVYSLITLSDFVDAVKALNTES